MPIRLGDLLVTNKVISENQLQEALHAQTVFGGRLGTNLVELGYLNEMDLAKLLSIQLDIPHIQISELEEIDPEVLKIIPAKLVEKYRVIPIGVDGKIVRLAMSDPTHYPTIDEISFVTGLRIDPVVAPEILLVYAAEKYYEVKREMRYIRAAGMAENLDESKTSLQQKSKLEGDDVVVEERDFGDSRTNEELVVDGFPIHRAVMDMVKARNVPDIVEVIKTFVAQDFQYVVVFMIEGENASGAAHVGGKLDQDEFKEFSLPVSASEVLFKVFTSKEPYVGVPTLSGMDHWYFSELGLPADLPMACFPVLADGQLRCVILASENKKGEIMDMMDTYQLLADKLGKSFLLVDMVDRILDLSKG